MDPEAAEKKFEDARRKEVDDKVTAELNRIYKLDHNLTEADKAFMQARRSYMSRADQQEYEAELSEDLTGLNTSDEKDTLGNLTRKELEARLQALGVQDTSVKVYRTNADLISAIEELTA